MDQDDIRRKKERINCTFSITLKTYSETDTIHGFDLVQSTSGVNSNYSDDGV